VSTARGAFRNSDDCGTGTVDGVGAVVAAGDGVVVGVGVGVGEAVGVDVGDAVGVGVGAEVGAGVALAVGAGVASSANAGADIPSALRETIVAIAAAALSARKRLDKIAGVRMAGAPDLGGATSGKPMPEPEAITHQS
jgi:hypothetical protein